VFSSTVVATGAVKPQMGAEVRVGARISGRVLRLHANIRDQVKKGQVLAELEHAELDATVAERQADLAAAEVRLASVAALAPREFDRAQAEVDRWRATVALAEKDLKRQENLLRQEFIAQQARDQSEERLLVARSQLASVQKSLELARTQRGQDDRQQRAEVNRARAALANIKAQLGYTVITAPLSGVVGSVSTQEGETVAAGLNAPTFLTIVDLSRLQVDAYVDEVDIGKIRVGGKATFTVDAFPATEFEASVMAIYPKAFVQDNVVKYVAALDISTAYEGKLRPEMTAAVALQLEARSVLTVPAKALRRERGRTLVYASRDGQPDARDVKIGWKDGPWAEIVSGLEEGQEIFVDVPVDPPVTRKE
jgi:macrolide-specific efflux system membrane fusion protein